MKKEQRKNGEKNPLELEKFAEDQKDLKNGYNKANKVSVFFVVHLLFLHIFILLYFGGNFSQFFFVKENILFIIFLSQLRSAFKAIILNLKAV